MTVLTPTPARTDRREPAPTTSRAWALAGVVAGVAGIGTIVTSGMVDAVYREDLWGDPQAIAEAVADKAPVIAVFHVVSLIGAVAMVVFAAGLHRRLAAGTPAGSLLPAVASAGLLATAVVTVLGTGLDTEFMFAFAAGEDAIDPSNMAMYNNWIGTIPWCWVLAGLSGVAVWRAARVGAVPTWIGRTGLVLGGLTLLLGISPMQYMAGLTGPVWLLVTALGLVLGDRAFRAGR
ncbi:MAG: hypothetical protein ACO1ON_14970 [Nocardioides sp.]|uniref:hypothetical protein n=1 Tax=Nocardioides sp. TaxID=35761 RepID=UPI00261CB04D|nr:hypothetical protein [Nocardioides sp.]